MSATATCYTCVSGGPMENLKVHLDGSRKSISVNVQLNDGQIPKWYQMAGNYSPLAPVFTRDPSFNWFHQQSLSEKTPSQFTNALTFRVSDLVQLLKIPDVDPFDTYVGYWGTHTRDYQQPKIPEAEPAYGDFGNSGIARANPDDSTVTLYYQNPDVYSVEGEVWPAHLHFTLLHRDRTWLLKAGAIDLYPRLELSEFRQVLRHQTALVVNSLPGPTGKEIPGSFHIPDHSNPKTIRKILRHQLAESPLADLVGDGIPKEKYVPICVFCQSAKCGSASYLLRKLRAMGYTNLLYYPGGIEEYTA